LLLPAPEIFLRECHTIENHGTALHRIKKMPPNLQGRQDSSQDAAPITQDPTKGQKRYIGCTTPIAAGDNAPAQ